MIIADLEHLESVSEPCDLEGGFLGIGVPDVMNFFVGRSSLSRTMKSFSLGAIGSAKQLYEEPVTIADGKQFITSYWSTLEQTAIGFVPIQPGS